MWIQIFIVLRASGTFEEMYELICIDYNYNFVQTIDIKTNNYTINLDMSCLNRLSKLKKCEYHEFCDLFSMNHNLNISNN